MYMSKEALDLFGVGADHIFAIRGYFARINRAGVLINMPPREGHFPGVNVLGPGFCWVYSVQCVADYNQDVCRITIRSD